MSLQLYNLSGAKISDVSEVKDCEYGSNVNGEYWKYANGLIIQFINKTVIAPCTTPYGSYFITNNQQLPIPSDLKTCLYKNASFQSVGGATFMSEIYTDLSGMKLNFRIANGTNWQACNGTVSVIIVGMWK